MKININRKPISSQEIGDMQDFGSVLKGAEATTSPFYKKWWFMGGVGMAIIVSIVAAALTFNNYSMPNTQVAAKPTPVNPKNISAQNTAIISPKEDNHFWVESGTAKGFTINNGSTIEIPKSHFVYSNGETVNGNVEVKYFSDNNDKEQITENSSYYTSKKTLETATPAKLSSTKIQGLQYWKNGQQVFTQANSPVILSYNEGKKTHSIAFNNLVSSESKEGYTKATVKSNTPLAINSIEKEELIASPTNKAPKKLVSKKETVDNEIANTDNSNQTKQEENQLGNKFKKPSFNISYPVDPNDSLNIALEKITNELKVLKSQSFKKPLKMEKAKQNFTMKFDSKAHPELATYDETIFGVADEALFTPALYKYKWQTVIVTQNDTDANSYTLQLSNATYIGEELFELEAKITKNESWLTKLLSNFKNFFTKKKNTISINKKEKILVKDSLKTVSDKSIRIIPTDSSQYYYQRSDYRSPVLFKVFPVLSDEQYATALKKYEAKLEQHKKLVLEKQKEEKDIRDAINERRRKRISAHRRKIEIYMGLTEDTDLQ